MRPLLFLGHERPLLPRREPRAAAPAQAGVGHGLDDLLGLHRQRLAQRDVAAGGDIVVIADELALALFERDAFGEDGFGKRHDFYLSSCYCCLSSRMTSSVVVRRS